MFCGNMNSSFLDKLKKLSNGNDFESRESDRILNKNSSRNVRRHLPVPSGEHTVGIVDFMCDRNGKNCFFRLYYPTTSVNIYERDRQWPLWLPRKQYGFGYVRYLKKNTRFFGKLFNWIGGEGGQIHLNLVTVCSTPTIHQGDVYVPALWQAVPLKGDHPYPLIIFSHGIGGNRTTYSTMCLELASNGFVIAALEHRDGTASTTLCMKNYRSHCHSADSQSDQQDVRLREEAGIHGDDLSRHHNHHHTYFREEWKWYEHVEQGDDFVYRNRQMYFRAEECQEVLGILCDMNRGVLLHNHLASSFNTQHLMGLLDISKVALVGHSFGASSCLAGLAVENMFRVGVMLDGWMHPVDDEIHGRVKQPALMLNMESFQWKENVEQMFRLTEDTSADRPMITIKGTCHQSVSDFQFLCSRAVGRVMGVRHTLDPSISMDLVCKAVLAFLWKHFQMKEKPDYEDILSGSHHLVVKGTNVEL